MRANHALLFLAAAMATATGCRAPDTQAQHRKPASPAATGAMPSTAGAERAMLVYVERIHDFSGEQYAEAVEMWISGLSPQSSWVVMWPNDAKERVQLWSIPQIVAQRERFSFLLRRRAGAPGSESFVAGLQACGRLAQGHGAKLVIVGEKLSYLFFEERDAIKELSKTQILDIVTYYDSPDALPELTKLVSGKAVMVPSRPVGERRP